MELQKINFTVKSANEKFSIIPIGDIHLGNRGCDIERLKKLVMWIKNKDNCYWIGMGDYIEAIVYTDKRFDPESIDDTYLTPRLADAVHQQKRDIINLLNPIADKCLGLHRGNHEEKMRLEHHTDIIYEMASNMFLNHHK